MVPSIDNLAKFGSVYKSSTSPRKYASPSQGSSSNSLPQIRSGLPNVQKILNMPEDAVWGLRKEDLRNCFLALRQYALDPYPLVPTASPTSPPSPNVSTYEIPPIMRLPVEIRLLIYSHLLPAPTEPPVRGPHPRQLQTNIYLSQPIPTSLLQLSHQIRDEALPILYGSPSQTIYISVDYNMWKHKTQRGELILSSDLTSSIKHIHISIRLGSEKRNNRPGEFESEARISEVKKGIKKVRKWLAGAELQSLRVSWQEPAQTYLWEQKKGILDGLRGLRAMKVGVGVINWGLEWNKGRKYRFEVDYLRELERE